MELLFFYINQSSTKFIEKQGFNFSPNYFFSVDCHDEKYILKQKDSKEKLPQGFFDSSNCISNITAVVGENGSGKTTLLNCIARYSGSVKDQSHDDNYREYFQQKYEQDKQVVIYRNQNKLICYHNIENFENTTDIECEYLYQGSKTITEMVRNNSGFENISKIVLSNSMYAEGGVSTHGSIGTISLNVNSLKTLKKMFYDKKCKNTKSCAGGYYEFQDILCAYRNITDFQQVLDILYLEHIKTNKIASIVAKNIDGNLTVNFQSFRKCLDDKFGDLDAESNKDIHLRLFVDVLNEVLSKFEWTMLKKDIFCVLYINLLFELITFCRFDAYEGESNIDNKEKLLDYIKGFIEHLTESKSEYAQYFAEAFEEISEYEQCMNDCKMVQCPLPLSDWAYISRKEIEYNSQAYDTFLKLIKKSFFERRYTFVLKYIDIGGLLLSSGERALLNFFSWMHLVPVFNEISNDVTESLRDNILLLIDEIDLYCHPSWQQKL